MLIREINRESIDEIKLVASRMRNTLVDVLGPKKGETLYSEDWLLERVKWHLSLQQESTILLVENDNAEITGQAIVRIEKDQDDRAYSFFSTIYVHPKFRRQGIATKLIGEVEHWSRLKELPYITYNTAKNNDGLVHLLTSLGYKINFEQEGMVQLKKNLKSEEN